MPKKVYAEYLGYARWFYQSDSFPVLQCIWPDKQHRYPWHPDCHPKVKERQPVLAQDHDWPFHEAKNLAVITTKRVIDDALPILLVSHDPEGDWQFLCGTTNRPKNGMIVSLGNIFDRDRSLAELADLPEGWKAVRKSADAPWRRSRVK